MNELEKRTAVLALAKEQVGITEFPAGTNKVKYNTWFYGREVQDGINLKGEKDPNAKYPWCGTSVSWIFFHAGVPLGNIGYLRGFAGCPYAIANLAKWGVEVSIDQAKPGDIIFIDFDLNHTWDHVEIIEGISIEKFFMTYGGNTSDKGSQSNGGAFLNKKRPFSQAGMKIVRPNAYNA